jgi:hypothetical protein
MIESSHRAVRLLISEQYNHKTHITVRVLYRFGKMIARKAKVVSSVDLHFPIL